MEHQIELTAESLWQEVAGRLRGSLNETTYGTWFGEARGLALDDGVFVLGVPNDFTRNWIEGHFLSLIGAAIRDVTGSERPIELRVTDAGPSRQPSEPPSLLDDQERPPYQPRESLQIPRFCRDFHGLEFPPQLWRTVGVTRRFGLSATSSPVEKAVDRGQAAGGYTAPLERRSAALFPR